jgi:hypothetical protein
VRAADIKAVAFCIELFVVLERGRRGRHACQRREDGWSETRGRWREWEWEWERERGKGNHSQEEGKPLVRTECDSERRG